MKIAANIAGGLLGFVFLFASVPVLLHLPMPEPKNLPPDVLTFMSVFAPSGYMTFVKALELIGGILVAIPFTRNFGLLVLGPIVVNILAFHVFIAKGLDTSNPVAVILTVLVVVLPLFLLWHERRKFLGLLG